MRRDREVLNVRMNRVTFREPSFLLARKKDHVGGIEGDKRRRVDNNAK